MRKYYDEVNEEYEKGYKDGRRDALLESSKDREMFYAIVSKDSVRLRELSSGIFLFKNLTLAEMFIVVFGKQYMFNRKNCDVIGVSKDDLIGKYKEVEFMGGKYLQLIKEVDLDSVTWEKY